MITLCASRIALHIYIYQGINRCVLCQASMNIMFAKNKRRRLHISASVVNNHHRFARLRWVYHAAVVHGYYVLLPKDLDFFYFYDGFKFPFRFPSLFYFEKCDGHA